MQVNKTKIKKQVEVLEIFPKLLDEYWNLVDFMLREGLKYDGNPMNISDLYKLINITYQGGFGSSTTMGGGVVVQPVRPHKFDMIVNSNLTQPTVTYPIYVRSADIIYIRPLSIQSNVQANYIRRPVDPHWGYNTINSDPVYNADSSTQFEISQEDETELVVKICKYAGLSIREADVVQVTAQQEQVEFTKENS